MTTKLTARQADKLIEAAQNAVQFTVEGNGPFPVDMLRYDLCWPASSSDSVIMNVGPSLQQEKRIINLKGLKAVPTAARWASFGWRVVES